MVRQPAAVVVAARNVADFGGERWVDSSAGRNAWPGMWAATGARWPARVGQCCCCWEPSNERPPTDADGDADEGVDADADANADVRDAGDADADADDGACAAGRRPGTADSAASGDAAAAGPHEDAAVAPALPSGAQHSVPGAFAAGLARRSLQIPSKLEGIASDVYCCLHYD